MRLKIFIDNKNFECLRQYVPPGAICVPVLKHAVHIANIADPQGAGNAVVTCDDIEARDLLMHARSSCPGAVTRISEALRAAGLTP
jgi:hypothetical protein